MNFKIGICLWTLGILQSAASQGVNGGGICAAQTTEQIWHYTDAVFVGTVMDVKLADPKPFLAQGPTSGHKQELQRVAVLVKIRQSWKGQLAETATLYEIL